MFKSRSGFGTKRQAFGKKLLHDEHRLAGFSFVKHSVKRAEEEHMVVVAVEFKLAFSHLKARTLKLFGSRLVISEKSLAERVAHQFKIECVKLEQSYRHRLYSVFRIVVRLNKLSSLGNDFGNFRKAFGNTVGEVALCFACVASRGERGVGNCLAYPCKVAIEVAPVLAVYMGEIVLENFLKGERGVIKSSCIGVERESGGEEGAL